MRPNVLLVVLDALRRDAIEPHGAPGGATPALAELARRGTALPYAYAASSWTLPSHASMFAGRLPRQLAARQPPDGSPQWRAERGARRAVATAAVAWGGTSPARAARTWARPSCGFEHAARPVRVRGRRTAAGGSNRCFGRVTDAVAWGIEALEPRPEQRRRRDGSLALRVSDLTDGGAADVLVREPVRVPRAVPAAAAVERPPRDGAGARRRRRPPVPAASRRCAYTPRGTRRYRRMCSSGCATCTGARPRTWTAGSPTSSRRSTAAESSTTPS